MTERSVDPPGVGKLGQTDGPGHPDPHRRDVRRGHPTGWAAPATDGNGVRMTETPAPDDRRTPSPASPTGSRLWGTHSGDLDRPSVLHLLHGDRRRGERRAG